MTKFEVIAYETENGDNPVEKFLDKLNPKMRAKIFGMLVILQAKQLAKARRADYLEKIRCRMKSSAKNMKKCNQSLM